MPDPNSVKAEAGQVFEVQAIGASRRRRARADLFVVALVGVLAFALGAAAGRTPAPIPSPSSPLFAAASTMPTAIPATASPEIPSRSPGSTVGPTAPAPWAWTRNDLLPGEMFFPSDIWSVGSNIMVLSDQPLSSDGIGGPEIARLAPGEGWHTFLPPRPVESVFGGSVIDGELWFLARVDAVSAADATLQLIGTRDGIDWEALGPIKGLGPIDGVRFIDRIGGRWVVATMATDTTFDSAVYRLFWSDDGVAWTAADVPASDATSTYDEAGSVNGHVIVLSKNDARILTSRDGRVWKASALPGGIDSLNAFACGDAACVLTGSTFAVDSEPIAWTTRDGTAWTPSTSVLPAGAGEGVVHVARAGSAFLGIGESGGWRGCHHRTARHGCRMACSHPIPATRSTGSQSRATR